MRPAPARLFLVAAATGLSTASAQTVDPNFNYDARVSHTPNIWGQAVAMIPLTQGWDYLFDNDRAPRATWDSQQPTSQTNFRDREVRTVLQTSQANQAFSVLFTGQLMTLGGQLSVGSDFDPTSAGQWQVYVDGEARPSSAYKLTPNTNSTEGFLTVGPLQSSSFHNVTIQTGPGFSGTMRVVYGAWTTSLMREGDKKLTGPLFRGRAGNTLSFADGNNVQPLLEPVGNVAVEQYQFQTLVLKGDASFSVMLPRNSSFVHCDGYIGPDYGVVNFALDPPPPGNIGRGYMSLSTQRSWYSHDTMFSLPLNPNLHYNFTVYTEATTAGAGVYLNSSLVFPYSDTPPTPLWVKENNTVADIGRGDSMGGGSTSSGNSSESDSGNGNVNGTTTSGSNEGNAGNANTATKSNVGAIAGGVVGGVLGCAVIALIAFLYCRRRRRNHSISVKRFEVENESSDSMTRFRIDDPNTTIVHPYIGGGGGASASTSTSPIPLKAGYSSPYTSIQMTPMPTATGAHLGDSDMCASPAHLSHSMPDHFSNHKSHGQSETSRSDSHAARSQGGFMTPDESTLVAVTKGMPGRPFPGTVHTAEGEAPEIVQELDGGAVLHPQSRRQELVPPQYNPEWASPRS